MRAWMVETPSGPSVMPGTMTTMAAPETPESPAPRTVLFIGDSITDCGRREDHEALGHGYVRLLAEHFAAHEPTATVINRGIGGGKVAGLEARVGADCPAPAPDLVTLYVAVNHAWHRHTRGDHSAHDDLAQGYRHLAHRHGDQPGDRRGQGRGPRGPFRRRLPGPRPGPGHDLRGRQRRLAPLYAGRAHRRRGLRTGLPPPAGPARRDRPRRTGADDRALRRRHRRADRADPRGPRREGRDHPPTGRRTRPPPRGPRADARHGPRGRAHAPQHRRGRRAPHRG